MIKVLLALCLLYSTNLVAAKPKQHRHHDAHVHGAATLNIAFDQANGKIEFKAASEGVLGFEHRATSAADKKTLNAAITKFESEISKMIRFEDSLGCVFAKEKIDMIADKDEHDHDEHKESHGEHSDFVANFNVTCKNTIKGSKITLDFTQFKGVKDLDVTLLIDDLQKSAEVKQKPLTIELK